MAVNRAGFPQSHSSSRLYDRQRKVLCSVKSKILSVFPADLQVRQGRLQTEFTLNNVGAYFLRSGDRAVFKPGPSWTRLEAIFIERK